MRSINRIPYKAIAMRLKVWKRMLHKRCSISSMRMTRVLLRIQCLVNHQHLRHPFRNPPFKTTIKTIFLSITLATLSISPVLSYADNPPVVDSGVKNLVAGFGSAAIQSHLMNTAPLGNEITTFTGNAQGAYLLSPNSPLVGPL